MCERREISFIDYNMTRENGFTCCDVKSAVFFGRVINKDIW